MTSIDVNLMLKIIENDKEIRKILKIMLSTDDFYSSFIPTLQSGLRHLQTLIDTPYTVHFSSLLTFDSSEYGLYFCESYCP